jgi:tetratricopeptide (TPR) repeat protein
MTADELFGAGPAEINAGHAGPSLPGPPRELPYSAALTGRLGETAALVALLRRGPSGGGEVEPDGRVVIGTIDGMGGVGKSALAIHVAHQVAGDYPGGQLYVNLRAAVPGLPPLQPIEALGRMLRSLGLADGAIPDEVEEAAGSFRSIASGRRLLVLLDDACSADQVRDLLPAGPGCGVLITSRRVLATLPGAVRLHLEVLPDDDSLELLCRTAARQRLAGEERAAAEILQLCGGLPLAIRIVGARLAARPAWPVHELAARLADARHRLELLQADDLTVGSTFEVSVCALAASADPFDRAAAAAFELLSVHDGPDIGVPAAARLIDQPEHVVSAALERLVDAGLLETPRPNRYRFHDLVRLYASRRARDQDGECARLAALTRFIAFYTGTAWRTLALLRPGDGRLADADPRWTAGSMELWSAAAALAWLELEHENLVAAAVHGAKAVLAGASLPVTLPGQLATALFGSFDVRGHWRDWALINAMVAAVARRAGDREGLSSAQNDLGLAYTRMGKYTEAVRCHRDSLTLYSELGDLRGRAAALGNIAGLHVRLGDDGVAIAASQQALIAFRESGDAQGVASTLTLLGFVHARLGAYEEAVACHEESLAVFRRLGSRHGQGISLTNLGMAYGRMARHAEAIACQRESLRVFRETGDPRGQAHSLNELGVVNGRMGRHREAIADLEECLDLFVRLGDRRQHALALLDIGDVRLAAGDREEAQASWRAGLTIAESLGIPEVAGLRDRLATR